jgi:hypothetical protein
VSTDGHNRGGVVGLGDLEQRMIRAAEQNHTQERGLDPGEDGGQGSNQSDTEPAGAHQAGRVCRRVGLMVQYREP